MRMNKLAAAFLVSAFVSSVTGQSLVYAQDVLPEDNGLATYHSAPRYRESESHPLRVLAYVFHPIGWAAREIFFRPLSYFASSTEVTRSVMGYREPYDYRQPECFSADDSTPDCRSVVPFNYDSLPSAGKGDGTSSLGVGEKAVYFPDVNFDFNSRQVNQLGKAKSRQVTQMLSKYGSVKVVLQGHTDLKGSDEYNMKLGMDRAEAVRKELVALGVTADTLSTVSFGESQPLFPGEDDWARAANRRVEVHLDSAEGSEGAKPEGSPVE